MCNMAGYVGRKRAAEVLIDMMRREEGFAGGYYTGIATINGGNISAEKCIGDLDRLLSTTAAALLSGNVGIMHSRSKGGGNGEWGHPFFGYSEEDRKIAYIANGGMGYFKSGEAERIAIANSLYKAGYELRSRMQRPKQNAAHPRLFDGYDVHVSDVMCQLIYKNLRDGSNAVDAIERAYCEMPGEIAGLLVLPEVDNAIVWARISMPIFLAFASHGVYVASTPLAFPDDAGEPILLPANSCGLIYADTYTVKRFDAPPAKVASIDASAHLKAFECISERLREGEKIFADLYKDIDELFEPAEVYPREPMAYEIIYALERQGKLSCRIDRVDGVLKELDAPRIRMRLIDE